MKKEKYVTSALPFPFGVGPSEITVAHSCKQQEFPFKNINKFNF